MLAAGEAGEAALHDERGDAVVARLGVGHSEHDEGVGHGTVGDEALRAVEHVVIAVEHRDGLLTGGVGTGVGLGQTERADLAAGQEIGEVLLLLLLGAVLKNRRAAEGGVRRDDDRGGAADLRQFLDAHGVGKNVTAGAAVFLREVNAHHAELGHLFDGLHGEALFLIDLLG